MSFIVLEGDEGVGKSIQISLLVERLRGQGIEVYPTLEPWDKEEIRRILAEDEEPYSQAEKLTRLFVEDRKRHVSEFINPHLEEGATVVSDRYKHSTIAYQSCQGIDLDYLLKLHEGLPVPDLTLVLDAPVDVILERLTEREDTVKEKKFETDREFLESLRSTYLQMPDICYGEPIEIIDASGSVEEVSEKIWDYVKDILE